MESLVQEFKEKVIINHKLPAIHLLPVELIEKVVDFVAEISTAPNSRDYVLHSTEVRDNLLSLSRMESIGGNWMICAEKQLCERVILSKINSEGLQMLAEMGVGDRRLNMIQEVYIYKVGDPEEYSDSHHISKSDVINLTTLLPLLSKLRNLYLALRFSDWQPIYDILLEKQIKLTTLWLYLRHDDDEDEGGLDDLAMDRIYIAGIPSLVDLSVTSSNAAIILHSNFFDDIPLKNLQILNLEGSEFEEMFPLLHLFPSLLELVIFMIFMTFDGNFFSYLPTTLRTLKMRYTSAFAQELIHPQDIPFYLQNLHLTNINQFPDDDLPVLSILPASVESITLEEVEQEKLLTALQDLSDSGGLKRLQIWNSGIGPIEEVTYKAWNGIVAEFQRLGIELEDDEDLS